MSIEITVPTLGESVTEATVAQWLKKPGDAVAKDEPVVELETDKVTLEVNAAEAGVLADIQVEEGDTVEVGTILGSIGEGAGASAPATKEDAPKQQEAKQTSEAEATATDEAPTGDGKAAGIAMPAAAKLMKEKQDGSQPVHPQSQPSIAHTLRHTDRHPA